VVEPDAVEHVEVAPGVRLHVRRWDGGDRRPALLVHGLASNARLWDGVALELAAAGHPVAAVDLRGHGLSDAPEGGYDVATVADDLAALLAHVGWDRPLVAGQSWGGNVVLELAARHPGQVGAVVGVDGGTIDLQARFPDWESCEEALAPPALAGTPLARIEAWLRDAHPDWPETGIQGQLACFRVHDDGTVSPHLDRGRHLLVLRGLWDHRVADAYGRIGVPVLLLGAEPPAGTDAHRERAADLEAAARAIPDGRVTWMRGDHDLHAQHPVAVARLLAGLAEEA